jgi:processive 1,2-diacylglycerol beta-glucosyltransferase
MEENLNKKGISILYLSVGSGHQVAAEALAEALYEQEPSLPIRVMDPFSDYSDLVPPLLSVFQGAAIVLAPDIYNHGWRRDLENNRGEWITNIGILQNFLLEKLDKRCSDTIIATHTLPCVLAGGLQKRGLIRKVFGVVTDFGLNSYWPLESLDGYFVAHEELRQTLLYQKFDPNKIFVTGIPIRKGFGQLSQTAFTINERTLRILIVAGGIGTASYMGLKEYIVAIIEGLQQTNERHLHLTIITGNKKRLLVELSKYKEQVPYELEILGFVKNMETIMSNHDILITKPGGLVISEALATGLCPLLIRPGPGQEKANVEFLARHGAALRGATPEEVLSTIHHCIEDRSLVGRIKENARKLGVPNSAQIVASKIISLLH